jgi:hypothetical protein
MKMMDAIPKNPPTKQRKATLGRADLYYKPKRSRFLVKSPARSIISAVPVLRLGVLRIFLNDVTGRRAEEKKSSAGLLFQTGAARMC